MSHSNDGVNESNLDLTPDQDGGVLKQIVKGGKYEGKPYLDDDVHIHVVGTLKKDGKVFYNTRKLGKPWKTKLQSAELPKALDIALRTMKKREIAIITCKPEYCYKDVSYKHKDFVCEVPANSTIVFEVELFDFRFNDLAKDKDNGVLLMRRFKKGDGYFYPTYNSEVCCEISSFDDYKGSETACYCNVADGSIDTRSVGVLFDNQDNQHFENDYYVCEESYGDVGYKNMVRIYAKKDGKKVIANELTLTRDKSKKYIEKSDFTWILGEGGLEQIPKGVEIAVENMLVGEKALFMVRYDYLKEMLTDEEYLEYKKNSEFYVFIITLKSCTKAKEYYEMSSEERLQEGLECKLKGNHYLTKRLNVELALKRYKRAIDLLEISKDLDGENSEIDELLFNCYLNISKAYFDAKTPELCDVYLNKALKLKPNNEKAIYRNGLLFMERKMYHEAKVQFENLLKHYPLNKAAIRLVSECERKSLEESSVQHNLYKIMSTTLMN